MNYGTTLFLSVLLVAGCGSQDPPAQSGNTSKTEISGPANQTRPVNSQTSPNQDNTAAAQSNTTIENPLEKARNKRLDAIRKAGADPNAPKLDVEAILKQSTRPAPENSQFAVALTDILVERRIFLSHPILLKAEKITEGEKKILHVYTRDGKTFDVPGDLVPSLSTAAASAILKAAGIQTPEPKPAERKPNAPTGN